MSSQIGPGLIDFRICDALKGLVSGVLLLLHEYFISIGVRPVAHVAELADALDSGSSPRKRVQVRLLS
jgi:hypothetical protein